MKLYCFKYMILLYELQNNYLISSYINFESSFTSSVALHYNATEIQFRKIGRI